MRLLLMTFFCCLASFAPLRAANADDILVVTTTAQIADTARNLLGPVPEIRVESIMHEGVDPHLYRPTRADTVRLQRADIVLYNGLHLEGRMPGLLDKLKKQKPVHAMSDFIKKQKASFPRKRESLDNTERKDPRLRGDDEENLFIRSSIDEGKNNALDPHIWMDAGLWRKAATGLAGALQDALPEHKEAIGAASAHYLQALADLDRDVRAGIASLPANRRILVTAHDAFGYFGKAYGIEVHGIQGISTESESGLRRIEELVSLIVDRQIPAVFIESSVSPRHVKALIEGARARGHDLKIGGELYSDAMGPAGTPEGTYIGMVRHNLSVILEALGGDVKP